MFVSNISDTANEILLSTSFEHLDPDTPHYIAPFVNQNNNKWALDTRSRSGRFAINVIPRGNTGKSMGFYSVFKRDTAGCLLNASYDEPYRAFDVSGYNSVVLEFWRYSTSNPKKRNRFNCGSSLNVFYRFDKGDWEQKMAFCGQHFSENTGWRHSKLEFDTKGHKTIEFKFGYDLIQSANNPTAVYLIDDLVLKGNK